MAKIILYSEPGRSGSSVELTDATRELGSHGFNDKVSSCNVDSGCWALYSDYDYERPLHHTPMPSGWWGDLDGYLLDGDGLSSLRPMPDSGIAFFSDAGTGGTMTVLDSDQSDVTVQARSAFLRHGECTIYSQPDFEGDSRTITAFAGTVPDLGDWSGPIRSLRLSS